MAKRAEFRDLFSGALELTILQNLNRKPMHGYALAQHIKAISDHLLQIEEGSLSPALQRMLKTGAPADSLCLQSRTHGHFIVAEAAEMVEMLNQGRLSPPIYCCGLGQFMPGVRIHT
jgi:Transcriptional regulator PadR-like family